MDPLLASVNDMLMEEGMEDDTCMQLDNDVSYQVILCSLYDIIGEHPLPQHVDPARLPLAISRVTSLPAIGNLQSSFFQKERSDTAHSSRNLLHRISPNSDNLNALSTQDYPDAIKFTDEEVMDTNLRSCDGSGSNALFQLPSPYQDFSLQLAGVELSFEDLKLHDHYAALYRGELGIPLGTPKEKGLAVVGKRRKSSKKRSVDAQQYVDLKDLTINCAQAVAMGDARVANELLHRIWQVHGASAHGNALQRAAHYFSEALVARMKGTGSHIFRAQYEKRSAMTVLKSFKLCFDQSPFMQLMHYFANQIILKAAERASRLHIVDYGIQYGIQWPFLINALADQKGGPPLLVITGIDFPQPGNNPAERLEESGRRLAAHARTYNVPFQYHAIVSCQWENLDSSFFHFHKDEVLVVNCINSLRHLASDESVDLISPRQKFFTSIHSLRPHLLITGDKSAAYNSPLFVSRFREAFYYYSSLFDMVDTLWGDSPEKLPKKGVFYHDDILNIVACEGAERVERAETYKQWQGCIKRAGFEQVLIPAAILSRSRSHVKHHYDKDFFVHDDAKWMLLGWKGRILLAISAWQLSHVNYLVREGDTP